MELSVLGIEQPQNPSTLGHPRKPQDSQHSIQNLSKIQGLWYLADHSSRESQNQAKNHNPYIVLTPVLQ